MITTVSARRGALIYVDGKPTWRYHVEPFRQAFLASGLTAREVEDRGGISRCSLTRLLGLRPYLTGRGSCARQYKTEQSRQYSTRSLSYENAVKVARALHLDLVEWEL